MLNGRTPDVIKLVGVGVMLALHYAAIRYEIREIRKDFNSSMAARVRLVTEVNEDHLRVWTAIGHPEMYRPLRTDREEVKE